MNAAHSSDFRDFVLGRMSGTPAVPFQPSTFYDADGDCIEFIAAPGPFYAQRLDDFVTVYRNQETDEVVGSLIKHAERFCASIAQRLPNFQSVVIDNGKVRLEHLFLAKMMTTESMDVQVMTTYRKLLDVAEKVRVDEVRLCASGT